MGGRWYFDKKGTVEESTKLSIFKLKEFGLLEGLCSSTLTWTWRLSGHKNSIGICVDTEDLTARVHYTTTVRDGNKTDYDYHIQLESTPCPFGGHRYWFNCPNCYKRVGCLHLVSGQKYFICRDCANLSYESRNESRMGRPGGIGYILVLDRKMEELHQTIKRWTYGGMPTRKARQYYKLLDRADHCLSEEELFKQLYRRR